MLVEEFSPAVEIARDDNHALYMIGDPTKDSKVSGRHEIGLELVGQNWKISF
ncbi:hypothetical protein [Geobacter sp. FeAm09]|uniref:hypothetical protein n=1 Tax=Geobacter sp. FeAm09 TaxID=2597769 RepID=UPI00143CC5C6|nr:hypothetical protein [Geobacter sp. FeAm09]